MEIDILVLVVIFFVTMVYIAFVYDYGPGYLEQKPKLKKQIEKNKRPHSKTSH